MALKTATVTWISYRNYGTFLQAYALQQALLKLGVENSILSDERYTFPPTFRSVLRRIRDAIFRKKDLTVSLYRRFSKHFLSIDTHWRESDVDDTYDVFFCGSDQIWSPYLPFNPYYYLGFTTKKKIAYAPSTGTGFSTDEYEKCVKTYINQFSHVSVREEDGARMLSRFIDKEIKVVLDPTLLLNNHEWDKVATSINQESDYIICYFLTPNMWYVNYVREYAERNQLKLKIFNTDPIYRGYGFEVIDAGPSEFISYIKGARKVFTDSFHASIFSVLYHKEFITFKRFKDGGAKDQNSRISNLFAKLGLSAYFIGEDVLCQIENLPLPDYADVDSRLMVLRNHSITFLQDAIAH